MGGGGASYLATSLIKLSLFTLTRIFFFSSLPLSGVFLPSVYRNLGPSFFFYFLSLSPFHPFYVPFSPLFSVSLSRFPALCDVTCGFKSCMVVYYRNTFLPSTLLTALFSPFPNFSIIIRPQTHKKKIA